MVFGLVSFIMTQSKAQSNSDSSMATINIIRQTGYSGSAAGLKVFIDSTLHCKLNTGKYLEVKLPAGQHTLSGQFYGDEPSKVGIPLTFVAEAGKTYYFMFTQSVHFASTEVFCNELSSDIGKAKVAEKLLDISCQ